MHPIIFKAGPIILYSFSLFLAIGLFLGSFVIWKLGREEHSEDKLFDCVLTSFISALLISRFFYIFSHFDFFGFDVLKWILFSHYPGFSFWGGFWGLFAGLIIFTRSKVLFRKFVDLFVLGISLMMIFGDIGSYLGGSLVGSVAHLPWAVIVPGFESTRHPLPVYLLVADLIVVVLIFKTFYHLKENRKDLSEGHNGLTALLYLSTFFILRGFAEFYKDKVLVYSGIPFLGIIIIFLGFIGIIIYYKKIGRSFKADLRTLTSKIYGKISSVKKTEKNSLLLLNDSLVTEKLSKTVIEKETTDGQPNP